MPTSSCTNNYKGNGSQLINSNKQFNQRVNNGYLTIIIIFILYLSSSNYQVSCRGGAVTRGSGGARGPHRRYNENEETDTLGVILVVILPVAQMIAVLTIIVLLRICYLRYCMPNRNNRTQNKALIGPIPVSPSVFSSTSQVSTTTTNNQPSKY